MKKNQPRQRPNQQLPQKQRRVERKAAEGRAAREKVRADARELAESKKKKATNVPEVSQSDLGGSASTTQEALQPQDAPTPPAQLGVTNNPNATELGG